MINRPALQWNDDRPDLFRARGRPGRIYRIARDGPGDWALHEYANEDAEHGIAIDEGPLAAMKRSAARHAGEAQP